MKPLTANQVIKILLNNGFVLVRSNGSHFIYKNIYTSVITLVPVHGGNKKIKIGTFLAIVRQSKISKDKFQ